MDGKDRYEAYREEVVEGIKACVKRLGCQPILFIGSGLSRRYFGGPSWDELLEKITEPCDLIEKEYAYYRQAYRDLPAIGEEFARIYQQWAWGSGRKQFPDNLFESDIPADSYLKFMIAKYFDAITPKSLRAVSRSYQSEIASLVNIKPHAIITTNYDRFLEVIFPDYHPIVGQKIIQGAPASVGEIYKIHGCVSDPNGMVLTTSDYEVFLKKKKYLSAKLLTYFSEHPLLFVGYGAGDPNIRAILSDIDEALPVSGGVIENVYILERRSKGNEEAYPAREKLIPIEDSRSVRINAIEADAFEWVFDAFGAQPNLSGISPKLLRALLVRSYELVRHDIPRSPIQADFKTLEGAVESSEAFANLFGVTTVADGTSHAANYKYNMTQLAKKVGYPSWQKLDPLIKKIRLETGIDIKSDDNKYHSTIMYGKMKVQKYSDLAVELLKKVKRGEPYEL
jgi:hypothetical protein